MEIFSMNMNSLLIRYGLIRGKLNNGIIEINKFGRFTIWFSICSTLHTGTKLLILLHQKLSDPLGDSEYFFGPKKLLICLLY